MLEHLLLRLDGVAGQHVEAAGHRAQGEAGRALGVGQQAPDAGNDTGTHAGEESRRLRQVERICPRLIGQAQGIVIAGEVEGAHFGIRSASPLGSFGSFTRSSTGLPSLPVR